jgi:hypothetical protein
MENHRPDKRMVWSLKKSLQEMISSKCMPEEAYAENF